MTGDHRLTWYEWASIAAIVVIFLIALWRWAAP